MQLVSALQSALFKLQPLVTWDSSLAVIPDSTQEIRTTPKEGRQGTGSPLINTTQISIWKAPWSHMTSGVGKSIGSTGAFWGRPRVGGPRFSVASTVRAKASSGLGWPHRAADEERRVRARDHQHEQRRGDRQPLDGPELTAQRLVHRPHRRTVQVGSVPRGSRPGSRRHGPGPGWRRPAAGPRARISSIPPVRRPARRTTRRRRPTEARTRRASRP